MQVAKCKMQGITLTGRHGGALLVAARLGEGGRNNVDGVAAAGAGVRDLGHDGGLAAGVQERLQGLGPWDARLWVTVPVGGGGDREERRTFV